mgnify:FL=1
MSEPAVSPGANAHRGETEIALGGTTYVLRPTFEALVEIERQVGKPVLALINESQAQGLPLDVLAVVVTECLRAHGRETGDRSMQHFNKPRIADLIYQEGLVRVLPAVMAVLVAAVVGGRELDTEKNAPPA